MLIDYVAERIAVSCQDLLNLIYVTLVIHSASLTSKDINWLR